MKNRLFISVFVLVFSGCWPEAQVEAAPEPNQGKSTPGNKSDSKLEECVSQFKNLKNQCDSKEAQAAKAKLQIEQLQKDLEFMRQQLAASGPRDPTWEELRAFLKQDKVDEKIYDLDRFNCQHFALELRDHARDRNIRGAYVILDYEGKNVGHAINAFETLDHGLIYIEPQSDEVVYIKKGMPFGTIPIEAVKRKYFACPSGPNGFTNNLRTEYFDGKLFEYEYFDNFLTRVKCYDDANDSLNSMIQQYNKRARDYDQQVNAYNSGRSGLSHGQLNRASEELDASSKEIDVISANLKSFNRDLGRKRTSQQQDVISKVKSHWN